MKPLFPLRHVLAAGCILAMSVACKKTNQPSVPDETGPGGTDSIITVPATGRLVIHPSPGNLSTVEHLKESDNYTVGVKRSGDADYAKSFVYKTDNYWVDTYNNGPSKEQKSVSFTSFSFEQTSVNIKISCNFAVNTVKIRPLNFNVAYTRIGNDIYITLASYRKIAVEVNDRKNPLFIFADAPDIPNPNATYYYGPGVHKIGLLKPLNSNESVYVAGGAVVEGSFFIPYNKNNISIKGRGILSMGEWKHESTAIDWLGNHAGVRANSVSNLVIEGVTFANTCGWTLPIYNSGDLTHDNQFRNIRMISWNGNTDGIWVNGNNNVVDDCFIFNNDDAIMSHGASNCRITNLTFWGGPWGRLYWSGAPQKDVTNMTFENINVIGKDGGPQLILAEGNSGHTLDKITFRNVRIEEHPKTTSYHANRLLIMNVGNNKISNWLFENVSLDYKNPDEGDFYGTANGTINGVIFKNLKMGETVITSLTQANMDKNTYANDIQFIP